jgi:hypothetical protein
MHRPLQQQIYIWLAKDLSWAQSAYYPQLVFGGLALALGAALALRAVYYRAPSEIIHQ